MDDRTARGRRGRAAAAGLLKELRERLVAQLKSGKVRIRLE